MWKKVKCEEESKKSVRESYFPPRSLLSSTLFLMGRKYVKVRKYFFALHFSNFFIASYSHMKLSKKIPSHMLFSLSQSSFSKIRERHGSLTNMGTVTSL